MSEKRSLTTRETFALAVENHQKNNLQAAENFYKETLKANPNHVDAHNNLGNVLKEVGERTMLEIVNKHGSDKVCFGTDFPLADMAEDAKFIEDLPLPGADKERILGENARAFIGL